MVEIRTIYENYTSFEILWSDTPGKSYLSEYNIQSKFSTILYVQYHQYSMHNIANIVYPGKW